MREYPMSLINYLAANNRRIGELERFLDEYYQGDFDPLNNSAWLSNTLFFQRYYKIPAEAEKPDCTEMFADMGKVHMAQSAKYEELRRPRFRLPVKLITDMRMQRTVDNLVGTPVEWQSVFRLPQMRKGQLELLKGLFESHAMNKIMAADTGIGKTWVMLAYAAGKATIIVEPDKGLQSQLKMKYGTTILMGRANYRCRDYGTTADISPCRFQRRDEQTCSAGCPWHDAYSKAVDTLDKNGIVVTNSWNMWQFFSHVDLIIFDEFHKILSELTVRYSIPHEITEETGLSYLQQRESGLSAELKALHDDLQETPDDREKAWMYNDIQNELQRLMIFAENYDGTYVYDDGEQRYLKLDKMRTMQYIATKYDIPKIFVSATPVHIPQADLITSGDSVSKIDNAPIVYFPVGKLTAQELRKNPDNLRVAADVINSLYAYFADHGMTKKVIIHTGNTTSHMQIAEYLNMKCLKHTKGALNETMQAFSHGNYEALLIAAADAGYDFYGPDFGLQFILKVPYPSLNAEWTAIKDKFGEVYETNLYAQEAITQIIQAAGRICRGTDDLGMTVILDGKFADLFNHNREKFPDAFMDRLVDLSGDLKGAVSKEKIDYYNQVQK